MNWEDLQDAIQTWFSTWTGLVVVWENEPRPAILRHNGYGILAVTTVVGLGQDFVQYSEGTDPNDQLPTVVGQRLFTVSCRVVSRSQAANKTGKYFLERARSSLKLPSVISTFTAAGIAIVSADKTVEIGSPFDDRVESSASFELTLGTTASLADSEDEGTIGTIALTSELETDTGPVPTPPNYEDLIVEIDP